MEINTAVLLEKTDKVAWIYLNRSKELNCINQELAEGVCKAIADCEQDNQINVIVLSGKGKAFCAGGDLKAIKELKTQSEAKAFVELAGNMTGAITNCAKPVIAMVNGVAAGAGFNLALAGDLIFSAENAQYIQSFSKVGLMPDCGGHYLLPRAIGKHWAKEIMFNACPITALEALEYGMINEVHCGEVLHKETACYAKILSEKPQDAIRACKALINQTDKLSLTEVLAKEAEMQSKLIISENAQEGINAFLEKREPKFK